MNTRTLTAFILAILGTIVLVYGCAAAPQPTIPYPAHLGPVRIAPRIPLTKDRANALGAQASVIRSNKRAVINTEVRQSSMSWTGIGVNVVPQRVGFAPAAATHSFGALFGTTDQAFTGEQIDAAVVYFNADSFNDNHLWTEARVIWRRVDGDVDSGNLIQVGASVGIYTNNVLLQTVILTSNGIVIPPGLRGRVQTRIGSRMTDIGNLVATGFCNGFDLHDAPGGSNNPLPTGGEIGSQTVVVDPVVLAAFQADNSINISFTKPKGLPVTLQGRAGATWSDMNSFQAATNRVLVTVGKPITGTPTMYRVIQTP